MKSKKEKLIKSVSKEVDYLESHISEVCSSLEKLEGVDIYEARKQARRIKEALNAYSYFKYSLHTELDYDRLLDDIITINSQQNNEQESSLKLIKQK